MITIELMASLIVYDLLFVSARDDIAGIEHEHKL